MFDHARLQGHDELADEKTRVLPVAVLGRIRL